MPRAVVAGALLLLAGCGTAGAVAAPPASTSGTAASSPAPTSGPSAVPTSEEVVDGGAALVGYADGSIAVSTDRGGSWRHWSPAALAPPGLTSTLPLTTVDAAGQVWTLAVPGADTGAGATSVPGAVLHGPVSAPARSSAPVTLPAIAPPTAITVASPAPATTWLLAELPSGSAFSEADLLHTVDGGTSWTATTAPFWGTVSAVDADRALLVGGAAHDRLAVTADGGSSWTPVDLPPLPAEQTDPAVRRQVVTARLADDGSITAAVQAGSAMSETATAGFYRRDPAGSWTLLSTTPAFADHGTVGQIADADHWLLASGTWTAATTDGGATWATAPAPAPVGSVHLDPTGAGELASADSDCVDKQNCTTSTALFTTTDSGAHWQPAPGPGS